MGGFLKGLHQVLTNTSYDFVKSQDGYFIRIKNIKLSKHLDSPLTSQTNENGVRDFINDMENVVLYICKTGLKDLVTFQDAQFEIIEGCYFNKGWNHKINVVIIHLYDLRLKSKKR